MKSNFDVFYTEFEKYSEDRRRKLTELIMFRDKSSDEAPPISSVRRLAVALTTRENLNKSS